MSLEGHYSNSEVDALVMEVRRLTAEVLLNTATMRELSATVEIHRKANLELAERLGSLETSLARLEGRFEERDQFKSAWRITERWAVGLILMILLAILSMMVEHIMAGK